MEFKLPELGEGVHEGEMVKWKVKVGDDVNYDQSLCEIMTDKATVEIPSAFKGKVSTIHAKEGEVVHVGQLLLTFEGAAQATAAGSSKASTASPTVAMSASAGLTKSNPAPTMAGGASGMGVSGAMLSGGTDPATRVLAAPATRRQAREMGVDLRTVTPSGPNGRVMKEDLARAMGGGAVAAGSPMVARSAPNVAARQPMVADERVAIRGLRKKISEKMRLSKDRAAHFTYVEEADATMLVKLREQAKEIGAAQGVKVTFLPFVMKAMVAALKQYPTLNSTVSDDTNEYVIHHAYNIGLSVQTEDGLSAPVVKNVESKTILEIAREIQDLVDRARHKKLTMADLTGGTITLTNAGSIGGLFATPVINYPEVAILGFNKIFRKPIAKMIGGREKVVVRDWTYFSISLDHRIIDGAVGAEFMKTFIRYIENPSLLLLESL